MQIDNAILPYVKGERFSNSLSFRIATRKKVVDRIEYLCEYAKGKRVIHIGCADHLPLIETKRKNNTWLHGRLHEVAEKLHGIDINVESLQYIKSLGFNDISLENILSEDPISPSVLEHKWDAIIMGEVLEHIENPVLFLKKVKERYGHLAKELIISVPNAMSIKNTAFSMVNKEQINSDHYYWFSPYTLSRILNSAGFTPLYFDFATYYSLNNGTNYLKKQVLKILLKSRPAFRPCLIYVAKF